MEAKIKKYLEGKASQEEMLKLIDWLSIQKNQTIFKKIKSDWKTNLNDKNLSSSTLLELDKFQSRILEEHSLRIRKLSFTQNFYKYAAILLLVISLGGLFQYFFSKNGADEISYNTVIAENGQISKALLPDSTVIWVNSGSTLKYSSQYGVKNRNIKLVGQAYFDVTKNKKLPFVVSCGEINVKVLGTRFSAEAYPESNSINVLLVEGAVELTPQNSKEAFVYLKPNEMMVYNKQTNQFQIDEVVAQKYTSWKDGIIHIYNLPLSEAVTKLEKRYNQLIVVGKGLEDYKVTFSIRNEDFSEVLDMLQTVTSAKVRQEGGIIYLGKR